MKKISILTIIALIASLTACDYNEDHFPGFDSGKLTDVVEGYESTYAGDYPEEGYFIDRTALQTKVDEMLKDTFKYVDKGSTAKISVLVGDITPGFSAADASYALVKEDYDAMGEENGQPGKYDNFDDKMDIDGYLIEFLGTKFASMEQGKVVSVTYMYYATGAGTQANTRSYKKEVNGWHRVELNAFSANLNYEMVADDYLAMGTGKGEPGEYKNFSSNMDIDHYISVMLNQKYIYESVGTTAKVTYLFHIGGGKTENRTGYFERGQYSWGAFNPYGDHVEVTTKIAEMEFDGKNWILKRLLGGAMKYTLVMADYQKLTDWVKINKPAYMSTQNTTDDYYFGASSYGNLNNKPDTWRKYYNVNGEYDGKSDEQMYEIMDARIAEGIINILLPDIAPTPDPGLSYQITYRLYGGRKGDGFYMQAFMYNTEEGKFEVVSNAPVKQ